MERLAWLKRLTDQKRPELATPLWADGWILATNALAMAAVQSGTRPDPALVPDAPASVARFFVETLARAPQAWAPLELEAFRAWLEPPQWPGETPCPECQGAKGEVCRACGGRGRNEHACPVCDHVHLGLCDQCWGRGRMVCGRCDGHGTVQGLPMRLGRIGGQVVNRELLARYLAFVDPPAEYAPIPFELRETPFAIQTFRGPGWVVLANPVRPGEELDDIPTWPLAQTP